jgi:HprK-related kinase A
LLPSCQGQLSRDQTPELETALSSLGEDKLAGLLHANGPGCRLALDLGLVTVAVRGSQPTLARDLRTVYGNFPVLSGAIWCDHHVQILPGRGLRRWWGPQARFVSDGTEPFEPFPADHSLPLLEWGLNWLIARRQNDVLLLHAGVVERDGIALVMPALPGSGKSTLTAALSLRGWRLLSDEFGAYDIGQRAFRAVLKPVALKNQSIQVIRAFDAAAPLGPAFERTRKGTVAHLAPDARSVSRRATPAAPGLVLFPRWESGSATVLSRAEPHVTFSSLAFNAFNYAVLGADGFQAVVALTRAMPAWHLRYSDLDDAIASIDRLCSQAVEHRGREADPGRFDSPRSQA